MKRKLIIKTFKLRANSNDKISRIFVVGYNTSKVNGRYIEKVGTLVKNHNNIIVTLKLDRIALWLNRGAIVKPKVSWYIGLLAQAFVKK